MPPVIDHHAHLSLNYGHRHKTGAEEVLRPMDEAGVDKSIVIDLSSLYGGDYRRGNAEAAEICARHPDRLMCFAYLHPPLYGIDECLRHCEEAVREMGHLGFKLHPVSDCHPTNSREYVYPVMEMCRELKTPIFIHTGHVPFSGPILVAELAREFPDVAIILGHIGHAMFADACYVAQKYPNVWMDTSMNHGGPLRNALAAVGPERILFGSDSPTSHPIACKGLIETLDIGRAEKDMILGGNIARLLGLEEEGR
ncbi:MAG: amidohydrolase family protein [bacterium]